MHRLYTPDLPMFTRRLALRTFLTLALLAVLLPLVLASSSLFYRSATGAMEEFALQLADEVSGRVREKVVSFFDVPQRVVAFNVEQVRAGYLMVQQPDVLMRQFMLQIDQQPQLTFISMACLMVSTTPAAVPLWGRTALCACCAHGSVMAGPWRFCVSTP